MLQGAKFLFGITSATCAACVAISVLLGCRSLLADTVYYRCVQVVGTRTNPAATMLVTIDPLLGEMKAEYSGKTLRSRTIYRIDVMNESITRGRYVLPLLGIGMVLELDRAKGRVTETVGSKEPTYYNCEPPSSTL